MEKAGSSPASTARYGRKKLTLRVFVLFVLLLPFHENLRVLLDLLSHSRMGAQELPQLRMTIQIILVIQQAWVFLPRADSCHHCQAAGLRPEAKGTAPPRTMTA